MPSRDPTVRTDVDLTDSPRDTVQQDERGLDYSSLPWVASQADSVPGARWPGPREVPGVVHCTVPLDCVSPAAQASRRHLPALAAWPQHEQQVAPSGEPLLSRSLRPRLLEMPHGCGCARPRRREDAQQPDSEVRKCISRVENTLQTGASSRSSQENPTMRR